MAGLGWRWAYVLFRFGDGVGHAFLLLLPVTHYGLPVWGSAATAAAMNLLAVPATAWWGWVMDRSHARRRIATMGFLVSGLCILVTASLPPFALYLLGASLYSAFGVATAPAAGVLVLEGAPRGEWAARTASFSRRSGLAYIAGTSLAVAAGLSGAVDPRLLLALVAASSVAASVVAWLTIVPAAQAPSPSTRFDDAAMRAGQRRFDRPVWLLGRLRNVPAWPPRLPPGRPGRLAVGLFVLFSASVLFFASYPGVLVTTLGLGTGMALLAQLPATLATPASYGMVRRSLERYGDGPVLAWAAGARAVLLLALMAAVLVFGRDGYVLLLVLHAAVGMTFAFVQVAGPCLLADTHPGGRGMGVGLFHASIGMGTLVGSATAFLMLLVAPVQASYALAAVLFASGVWLVRGTVAATAGAAGAASP